MLDRRARQCIEHLTEASRGWHKTLLHQKHPDGLSAPPVEFWPQKGKGLGLGAWGWAWLGGFRRVCPKGRHSRIGRTGGAVSTFRAFPTFRNCFSKASASDMSQCLNGLNLTDSHTRRTPLKPKPQQLVVGFMTAETLEPDRESRQAKLRSPQNKHSRPFY